MHLSTYSENHCMADMYVGIFMQIVLIVFAGNERKL